MEDGKSVARQDTDAIVYYCDSVVALLQSVAVKLPRVASSPLYLLAYKNTQGWFCRWYYHHLAPLSTPLAPTPQDHPLITGFLSNVAKQLQNSESLCPVVAVQRKVDK